MGNMFYRAIRAAMFRRRIYRESSEDPGTILKSLGLVAFSAISLSLGLMNVVEEGITQPELMSVVDRLIAVWLVIVVSLLGWIMWAAVVYLVGARFLGGNANYHQVLRVLGICYGPGFLFLFISVPVLGFFAFMGGLVWILVSGIIGIREVLQIDWIAAVLATTIGWALFAVILPFTIVLPNVN